ncbi:MAG: TlpA family protein disulfide reductase [Bacteroidaceae bacterium]|nr:TlpA family protein disulfide reductase [Bacteroidaceae bacterium]
MLTSCINDNEEYGDATMLVHVGDAVPDFVVTSSEGEEVTSKTLAGQVYILNFFDTRCPDCQQEFQVLQRIYDKYHEQVPILNVPRSETMENIQAYWEKEELSLPYYLPKEKDLYYQFATKTIPRTYVVDKDGKVLAAFSDAPIADFETLDGLLQTLLGNEADDKGSVNLSLRVKVANRSIDMEDFYFHNEYTISRLNVYFFDAETKKFFTKAIISDLTQEDAVWNTEYDITYLYDRISLKAGKYDIFAIGTRGCKTADWCLAERIPTETRREKVCRHQHHQLQAGQHEQAILPLPAQSLPAGLQRDPFVCVARQL